MLDMNSMVEGKSLEQWIQEHEILQSLVDLKECAWLNKEALKISDDEGLKAVGLSKEDVQDAALRLKRFSSYFVKEFESIKKTNGILESPLCACPSLQEALCSQYNCTLPGRLWLKLDSELPISGSIKARGGIYEVLYHAEQLAAEAGLIDPKNPQEDYAKFASQEFKDFFSQYTVAVGSTGNLGLSIGIMSASLGFKAAVHMSADARQWKKDKLRAAGVQVIEYEDDYSKAVQEGRKQAEGDPYCYFVDDENSKTLFCGYAVAARRLAHQLAAYECRVDEDHPLFVYLPCGVGGGPGGVAFGLKLIFGKHVHIIFTEPSHCPSMMLGVVTQLHNKVSVKDFGIDNVTAADGLACARPSGFVGKAMWPLIDGFTTVDDDELYKLLALAYKTEDIFMEPSSAASIKAFVQSMQIEDICSQLKVKEEQLQQSTHIAWITGGSMVPAEERHNYLSKGNDLI